MRSVRSTRNPKASNRFGVGKQVARWGLTQALPRRMFRRAAARGDLQGRLLEAMAGPDPNAVWPVIEEMRAAGSLLAPVSVSWASVDHHVCKEVLTSPDFRVGNPELPGWLERGLLWAQAPWIHPLQPPSLLATEPPDHTRYRRLVTRVFTNRAVQALRSRTEEIAEDLLRAIEADVAAGRPVDLVESYCGQLPLIVICEILGVPEADRGRVFDMGSAAAASLDLGLSWADYRAMDAGLRDFDRWLEGHLAHLREHPGDDLMSQLAAAQDEGAGLTLEELKATAGLVLVAGFETTVNLLGNAIALLTEHRDQLDLVLADGSRWANVVEEVLRIDPPVLLTSRVADRPTRIAGVALRKGSTVLTCLAGANRDPKIFPEPERFDITRENARDHLAFSAGRHHCLGAQLARMEGEVGLRALFERFPDLRLLPGAERRHTQLLRGYATLPAVLGQARTPSS
ncbi:MAG TPA: cytochrome P450 [Intrasporangiaceae bacterium]|nr:cytochrome P450 [Intrasporangiaceae bacterium]